MSGGGGAQAGGEPSGLPPTAPAGQGRAAAWRARVELARDRAVAALRDGRLLLALGAVIFAVSCLIHFKNWDLPWVLGSAPHMLAGRGPLGDFASDMVGFRRLLEGRDPYPVLAEGFREIGLAWDVQHASTHPPTAYLFAAPLAYASLATASRCWALIGYLLVFASMRLYGLRWRAALGITLAATAWKPFAASFQQLTFVWLAATGMAWRFRERRTFWAGAGIGAAALTKLLPIGILGWFVFQRRFRAVAGAAVVVAAGVAAVWLLHPGAFVRWSEVQETARQIIRRADNASPLRPALAAGVAGLVALGAYLAVLVARNWRMLFVPAQAPEHAFFFYSYLAVLLLPISWGYSFAPLAPVLGYFAVRGRAEHVLLALGVFLSLGTQKVFGGTHLWVDMLAAGLLFWSGPLAQAHSETSRPTP